jgi:hypothetical protein
MQQRPFARKKVVAGCRTVFIWSLRALHAKAIGSALNEVDALHGRGREYAALAHFPDDPGQYFVLALARNAARSQNGTAV